jgi:hypothetical protein
MNIKKLKEYVEQGNRIKNYRVLCEVLEIPIKTSNAKKAQLKEIATYCKFHKEGNEFVIDEFYDKPLPKEDNRKGHSGKSIGSRNNNNIFNIHIQKLILDQLVLQLQDGQKSIYLSTCRLMETIAMINSNYAHGKENVEQLAKYLDIDEDNIYEFYQNSYGNLKNTLESALRALANKALIIWDTVTTIVEKNGEWDNHRVATEREKETIIQVEKEVLKQMEYTTKRDVVVCKRWKEFMRKVNNELQALLDIKYYYKSYSISFNEYVLEEQKELEKMLLENGSRDNEKHLLNNKIATKFIENADKRRQKAKNKLSEHKGFGKPNVNKLTQIEQIRVDKDYMKQYIEINDTVINIGKSKITN